MEGGPTRPGSSSRSETPETLEWRPSRRKEEGGASDQDDAMEAAERGHIRAGQGRAASSRDATMESLPSPLVCFLRFCSSRVPSFGTVAERGQAGCILKATYYQFDIRYSSSSNLIDAGAPPWEGARQPPCGDSSSTPTPPHPPPFGLLPLWHSCSSSRSSDGGGLVEAMEAMISTRGRWLLLYSSICSTHQGTKFTGDRTSRTTRWPHDAPHYIRRRRCWVPPFAEVSTSVCGLI